MTKKKKKIVAKFGLIQTKKAGVAIEGIINVMTDNM